MKTFVYKAKKKDAATVTGQIKAKDEDHAIDLIHQLGLTPVSLDMEETDVSSKEDTRFQNIKAKDLFIFTKQLANLLKSGVSILKALAIIEDQFQNTYFKKIIADISTSVKNGKSLSSTLEQYPDIFSILYIAMVKAGEESSNLDVMLRNVAIYQKKQAEIRSKIKNALLYPVFMALVGVATIYFILTYVLPKMSTLFSNIEKLPRATTLLLSVSNFLSHNLLWSILIIASIGLLFINWRKSAGGKVILSNFVINFPILGRLIQETELARFCRTLVLLLNSGVSIIKSLDIAIPILSNEVIKKELMVCKEALIAGGSFGQSLKDSKKIPSMMGHMITVGEETGNLHEVLSEIADSYESENDEMVKSFTTLLEPVMIVCVGAVIGFIVFAMLMPIFQMDVLSY